MLVKDEQEASVTSMPNTIIGQTFKSQDGKLKLNELLVEILFSIGHPRKFM